MYSGMVTKKTREQQIQIQCEIRQHNILGIGTVAQVHVLSSGHCTENYVIRDVDLLKIQ